ncbi:MAG: AMP-binding protein [Dehalococcoidia bacterium]
MVLGRLRILGPDVEEAVGPEGDPHDGPQTFAELIETARRTWGTKVAFQQKVGRQWTRATHEDIYARSHALAAGFGAMGLSRGERVAMVLENSIDWICSYYAIVLNGAIAVPIYFDLKPPEIAEMVGHSEARMAIVSAKALGRLAEGLSRLETLVVVGSAAAGRNGDGNGAGLLRKSHANQLSLDDVAARATPEARQRVAELRVDPDDLASIVFTSGTSGGMKGVTLTHRNFMSNLWSIRRAIPFGERDRLVMVLPMHHAFPFTVTAVVAPAVGGEVTFENDLRRIRDRMAEIKPTLFCGMPALFEIMYRNIVQRIETEGRLETFERGLRVVEGTKQRTGINIGRIVFRELHKRLGSSLRFMISGGAALNPQTARDFALLGVPILQGWGLTEAAPVLAVQRWHPRKFYMSNYYEERVGTVGQALDGVDVALIDVPEKELYVHLHGEGELVARGGNITPGYWHSDDATAAAKVGEWLRTGDVGRIDDEGNIWITGRSKFVIVLESGEKVHPDEVEEKLQRSAVIEDIVVMGRKARGKTQVAAVVYPNHDAVLAHLAGAPVTEEAVRGIVRAEIDRCEADVAGYKRTSEFLLTDAPLPKTAIRKVMRGQLAESYSFEPGRWAQTWQELQESISAPSEEASEEAVPA